MCSVSALATHFAVGAEAGRKLLTVDDGQEAPAATSNG